MAEPTIICPKCKAEIKLTESLAAPLIESTRKEFEQRLAAEAEGMARREAALEEKEAALSKAKAAIEAEVAGRLKGEQTRIAGEEARKAKLAVASELEQKSKELAELEMVVEQRSAKLAEAQEAQAALMRKQRELDDAKREIELTIEKRVQEGLAATRQQARKEAEEGLRLRLLEREQTIASMQTQIEALKRKAEQGSQQLQGEVQELELEALLRAKFVRDVIEPVPKGEHGGDVVQRVVNPLGQVCGSILWESKRTRNWSDTWLGKLREDQRAARAEVAILVSQALPKEVDSFDLVDGVWVTPPRAALPLAMALRQTLVEVAFARQASEGQQGKMEVLYQYLTGPRFRQRVQAIVEAFSGMQEDLAKEKRAIMKQWAKREEQIQNVMAATVGMYGDLQGIAGQTIPEIEGLEMKAIESPEAPADEEA